MIWHGEWLILSLWLCDWRLRKRQHGCTLINDSYNSDINSLDIALDFMNRRPDHKGRKRTLILSDILQSGEAKNNLYPEVADLAEKRGVEKFIGIGEDLRSESDAFSRLREKYFFATVSEFINSDVFKGLRNEVILLKRCSFFWIRPVDGTFGKQGS